MILQLENVFFYFAFFLKISIFQQFQMLLSISIQFDFFVIPHWQIWNLKTYTTKKLTIKEEDSIETFVISILPSKSW